MMFRTPNFKPWAKDAKPFQFEGLQVWVGWHQGLRSQTSSQGLQPLDGAVSRRQYLAICGFRGRTLRARAPAGFSWSGPQQFHKQPKNGSSRVRGCEEQPVPMQIENRGCTRQLELCQVPKNFLHGPGLIQDSGLSWGFSLFRF